ncbi:hypothetical protein CsSME_00004401 [Camellia sinensis var. sinensis]
MGLQSWMKKELPFAVMVMLEFGDVCTKTLTKAAMNTGMNSLVFVAQNPAASAQFLSPVQILTPWSTWICLFTGINYSSPTLAAALGNLFPAFTFLLAVLFRPGKMHQVRQPYKEDIMFLFHLGIF